MRRSILIEKLFIRVCTCDVQTQSGLILTLHVILSSDELALVPRAAHHGLLFGIFMLLCKILHYWYKIMLNIEQLCIICI